MNINGLFSHWKKNIVNNNQIVFYLSVRSRSLLNKLKMPVVIFLLDNSASMNQMTHIGTSLFDIGKGAIDQFFKVRYHLFLLFNVSFVCRFDSEMLVPREQIDICY
jgi:hypothetical protein